MSKAVNLMLVWLERAGCAVAQTTAPTSSTTAPLEPRTSSLLTSLVGVGLVVLAGWILARIIRPKNLRLTGAPGRPNVLSAPLVLTVLLAWLVAAEGASKLIGWLWSPGEALTVVVSSIVSQVVLVVGSLALAKHGFQHGLRRGMGFCFRHGAWDVLRAVIGYLALLPVCIGALLLAERMMNPDLQAEHVLIEAIDALPGWQRWLVPFGAIVLAPLGEELFFRGVFQSMLRRRFASPWTAILATSVLFALLHIGSPQSVGAIFILSVVLGYNYERTGRLIAPIVIHMLFNAVFIAEKMLG